jgi:3-dehydroquinate dehydratase I
VLAAFNGNSLLDRTLMEAAMKTVKIKNLEIGTGIPKICVSITGATKQEVIEEALNLVKLSVDIIEWRADYYHKCLDKQEIISVLEELSPKLKSIPLLFTLRSMEEGGQVSVNIKDYEDINMAAAASGYVDLIDIEAFKAEAASKDIIQSIQLFGVKVIASYHDFNKTPSKQDILSRLKRMAYFKSDILKIAHMPKSKLDVLGLMEALTIMTDQFSDIPVIAISMSDLGVVSRVTGEVFGSAVTFASSGKASAPGQPKIEDLRKILNLIHELM